MHDHVSCVINVHSTLHSPVPWIEGRVIQFLRYKLKIVQDKGSQGTARLPVLVMPTPTNFAPHANSTFQAFICHINF